VKPAAPKAEADAPSGQPDEATIKRLTEKVERVKAEARKWAESGRDPSDIRDAMEKKFNPLMKAGKLTEAEAEMDRVLKTLSGEPEPAKPAAPKAKADAPSGQPDEATIKRLTEKVERISAEARKWAESGRDPSDIRDAMEKKFKPLMGAGKLTEAEAELDRMLKTLVEVMDAKPDSSKEEGKTSSSEAATHLEQVATGFRLAEGPVWDGENLIFSDVFPSEIKKLGADGTVSTMRSDTRKGAGLALDSKGRLLICEVDGFRVTRIEKDGKETTLADSYAGKKLNGPNDLAVDTKDGVYFTDPLFLNKDKREQDKEAVYYISPEGKVLRVADDLVKPNGIALAGDGKTLFVADTMQSKLRAYPVKEDGTLGEGRDFGTVPGPDGVRVDMDGRVYAAGKTGIAVWDATGKPLGTLKTPTSPNSLTFGGADRRTMFITTNPSVFKIRLDQVLKLLTAGEPATAQTPAPAASAEATQQRIMAKIERIKEGVHELAKGGTDPSAILKTMQEKVGPLLDAGKITEAEPELDRVLEQLKQDAK
jgi:gluconolactonase